MLIGVDIGGTSIKIGLFTNEVNLIKNWNIPTDLTNNGDNILKDIAISIKDKFAEFQLDYDKLLGIGVGVPGPVLNGREVLFCVNLGWKRKNVANELSKLTNKKVCVINDANAAGLGETVSGCGKKLNNTVFITLGTGVGGAIIINKKVLSGIDGICGELGHLMVKDDETEKCNCGRCGCLEQYSSATGVINAVKKFAVNDKKAIDKYADATAEFVFNEAKKGDIYAVEAVDFASEKLALAMANIACVINPDAFIIGGGMALAGDFLIDKIKKYYVNFAFSSSKNTAVIKALLENSAGIYGSAIFLKDSFNYSMVKE